MCVCVWNELNGHDKDKEGVPPGRTVLDFTACIGTESASRVAKQSTCKLWLLTVCLIFIQKFTCGLFCYPGHV